MTRREAARHAAILATGSFGGASRAEKPSPDTTWPQAAGPHGTWRAIGSEAPVAWSASRNQSLVWRVPLPNGGQSGIAVWGSRLFLTTFAVGEKGFSSRILGLAVDKNTGRTLWSVTLEGPEPSPVLYAYSDSTTPTPITDGQHVWFTNASGEMACFDWAGKEVWRRKWKPWGKPFPFNKQHQPILHAGVILNVEPGELDGWNYLHAIDKQTGKVLWVAEDGTTTYNRACFGIRKDGTPAILHGRGGWHDVPEKPVGLSLMSLQPGREGKTIWRFIAGDGKEQAPTWQSLYVMHWDAQFAYWFRFNPEESHLVIDSETGRLVHEQSLIRNVDYRQWDAATNRHVLHTGVNLRDLPVDNEPMRVMPAWHGNIVAGGYHYFLTTRGHRRNSKPPKGKAGPAHCVGRVHITSGKVEYLELPVTVVREPGKPDQPIYGTPQRTETKNAEGVDIAAEDRSRTDGWEIPAFFPSPVAINGNIYFTAMLGITYVIDSAAPRLDSSAFRAVNDLGPSGKTWSLTTPAYDGRRLYHRTAKELIAIGR